MKTILQTIICLALFASCSSGKNQMQRGNYDQAVSIAVNRLQRAPNHKKTRSVLQRAYKLAVETHIDNIKYHLKNNDAAKQDKIVTEYLAIQRLNNAIRRYSQYKSLLKLRNVDDALIEHKKYAANEHLIEANNLLEIGTKRAARLAYAHLEDVNYYIPGMASIATLDEARLAGTVTVKLNFINKRSFFKTFNTKLFYNEVRNTFKNTDHRFLKVIENENSEYDEIIDVEMNEILVSGMDKEKDRQHFTKEIFIGQVEDDSGKLYDEFETVSADYTTFRNRMSSTAILMIQRKNYGDQAPQFKKIIPSTFEWVHEWARYQGDKRALTKEQLEFTKVPEATTPNPLWMIEQASKPLLQDCATFLWEQYNYLR